ncbi:hypothetical protein ACQ4PT_048350 [Festuca glaucescens]
MFAGLASEDASKVRMLLTCVDSLPDGSEEGIYYAIDIGGTCFRFLKVELGAGSTIINQKVEYQPIKEELTKGTSEVGKDVAQCLNEALVRNGLNLQVNALVVNVEWGSFRPPQIPLTPYDICFNNETQNYYDQGFEKMISGVYLGEIARLVFQKMAQELDVFGTAVDDLATPFILSTPCLAAIREDDSLDLREVGRRLEEHLKIPNVPLKTRRLVQRVCDIITRRAARLAAAGIVAVLQKIGRDGTRCGTTQVRRMTGVPKRSVIAIEGGLYQGYSVFREYLNEAVVEILGKEIAPTVVLRVVEEGSGIGAALLSAAYSSNRQESI